MAVESVSDTARWLAWLRAEESDRADSLFKDPLLWRMEHSSEPERHLLCHQSDAC